MSLLLNTQPEADKLAREREMRDVCYVPILDE